MACVTTTDLADQLTEMRLLLSCAFMACAAIDDDEHTEALQTVIALVESRLALLARQMNEHPPLLAA